MKASLRLRILLEEAVARYAQAWAAEADGDTSEELPLPTESDFVEEIVRIVEGSAG